MLTFMCKDTSRLKDTMVFAMMNDFGHARRSNMYPVAMARCSPSERVQPPAGCSARRAWRSARAWSCTRTAPTDVSSFSSTSGRKPSVWSTSASSPSQSTTWMLPRKGHQLFFLQASRTQRLGDNWSEIDNDFKLELEFILSIIVF